MSEEAKRAVEFENSDLRAVADLSSSRPPCRVICDKEAQVALNEPLSDDWLANKANTLSPTSQAFGDLSQCEDELNIELQRLDKRRIGKSERNMSCEDHWFPQDEPAPTWQTSNGLQTGKTFDDIVGSEEEFKFELKRLDCDGCEEEFDEYLANILFRKRIIEGASVKRAIIEAERVKGREDAWMTREQPVPIYYITIYTSRFVYGRAENQVLSDAQQQEIEQMRRDYDRAVEERRQQERRQFELLFKRRTKNATPRIDWRKEGF